MAVFPLLSLLMLVRRDDGLEAWIWRITILRSVRMWGLASIDMAQSVGSKQYGDSFVQNHVLLA